MEDQVMFWKRVNRTSVIVVIGIGLAGIIPLMVYGRALIVYGVAPWQTGDWLIDYTAGFTRRGFIGQITLWLSEQTGLSRLAIIFCVQALAQVLFTCGVALLFLRGERGFHDLLLISSPMFLLFYVNDYQALVKKEVLLFLLLLWVVLPRSQISSRGWWINFAIGVVAYIVFGLSHEIVILGSPLVLYGIFRRLGDAALLGKFWKIVVPTWILLSAGMLSAFLMSPLSVSGVEAICSSAISSTGDAKACEGAIEFMSFSGDETLNLVASVYLESPATLATFLIAGFLSGIPILMRVLPREFSLAALLTLVSMSPAFAFGLDWGRWLAIFCVMSSILSLRYFPVQGGLVCSGHSKLLQGALLLGFSLTWSVGSVVGEELGPGLLIGFLELMLE